MDYHRPTVRPIAAALFLTRSGGFAWVFSRRSDAPLISHCPWVAAYQPPGVMDPGRYETRQVTLADDGCHSSSKIPCAEDLVRLCVRGVGLELAAPLLGAYMALLRLPHGPVRLELQAAMATLRAQLADLTGETQQEVQDRYEELVFLMRPVP